MPEWRLAWALGVSLLATTTVADERCFAAAKTELENLYCEVIAEGGGASLPAQADFNRNDPTVQALLLKRPAERLGLTLPEPQSEPRRSQPQPASESARNSATPHNPVSRSAPTTEPSQSFALDGCQLSGEQIRCRDDVYRLASNQQRSALAEGALGPGNRLTLPPFRGDRKDETAVRRYLSKAYDHYIPKMLQIGLGANTMSFTAFHNAFHTLEAGGVDFATRMAETYELLKQDRQNLGVQARYHNDLPESLSLCDRVNSDIVVCDNVGTNWVFVRQN